MSKPTILVIGHGRHGKDTFCDFLRDDHGFNFISSSEFVGREILFDLIGSDYDDFDSFFEDRVNRRKEWFEAIRDYNTPDGSKTATTMMSRGYDIYCGMRSVDELEACVGKGIFDRIVWVDRGEHIQPELELSCTITSESADTIVNNNGSLEDLRDAASLFVSSLRVRQDYVTIM
jgi:hypothetical protein